MKNESHISLGGTKTLLALFAREQHFLANMSMETTKETNFLPNKPQSAHSNLAKWS